MGDLFCTCSLELSCHGVTTHVRTGYEIVSREGRILCLGHAVKCSNSSLKTLCCFIDLLKGLVVWFQANHLLGNLELEESYVELRAEIRRHNLNCLFRVVERCPECRDTTLGLRAQVPGASEVREDLGIILPVLRQCCFVLDIVRNALLPLHATLDLHSQSRER